MDLGGGWGGAAAACPSVAEALDMAIGSEAVPRFAPSDTEGSRFEAKEGKRGPQDGKMSIAAQAEGNESGVQRSRSVRMRRVQHTSCLCMTQTGQGVGIRVKYVRPPLHPVTRDLFTRWPCWIGQKRCSRATVGALGIYPRLHIKKVAHIIFVEKQSRSNMMVYPN